MLQRPPSTPRSGRTPAAPGTRFRRAEVGRHQPPGGREGGGGRGGGFVHQVRIIRPHRCPFWTLPPPRAGLHLGGHLSDAQVECRGCIWGQKSHHQVQQMWVFGPTDGITALATGCRWFDPVQAQGFLIQKYPEVSTPRTTSMGPGPVPLPLLLPPATTSRAFGTTDGGGGGWGEGKVRPPERPLRALDRCPCPCFCLQRRHLGPSKLLGWLWYPQAPLPPRFPWRGGWGGEGGGAEGGPQKDLCGPWTGALALANASSNDISGLRNPQGGVEGGAKSDPQCNLCRPWTSALALAPASNNDIPGLRIARGG